MTEKKYKTVQVAGQLFIPGLGDDHFYTLLAPHPIRRGDSWFSDDMAMFYVASYRKVPHHIVVKGPFVIDYWNAGRELEVQEPELDEELKSMAFEGVNLDEIVTAN